jgi:hypothetical protein
MNFKTEYEYETVTIESIDYSAGCDMAFTGLGFGDCEPIEPEYIEFEIYDVDGVLIGDHNSVSRSEYERILKEAKMEFER